MYICRNKIINTIKKMMKKETRFTRSKFILKSIIDDVEKRNERPSTAYYIAKQELEYIGRRYK